MFIWFLDWTEKFCHNCFPPQYEYTFIIVLKSLHPLFFSIILFNIFFASYVLDILKIRIKQIPQHVNNK